MLQSAKYGQDIPIGRCACWFLGFQNLSNTAIKKIASHRERRVRKPLHGASHHIGRKVGVRNVGVTCSYFDHNGGGSATGGLGERAAARGLDLADLASDLTPRTVRRRTRHGDA